MEPTLDVARRLRARRNPVSSLFANLRPLARAMSTRSAGLYARAVFAAVAATVLFFALSYAATFVDRQAIVAKLEGANARDAFRRSYASWTGRAFPRFAGNDCLFWSALMQDYPGRLAQAISIRIPPADVLPPLRAGEPTVQTCLQMIAALDRSDHANPRAVYYHHYLHGQRVYAALTSAIVPPEAHGWLTLGLNSLALLSVLVPALHRSRLGGPEMWRERGFAAISGALLLCDGLWLYGVYFSFGISDLVLSIFLCYAYHRGVARAPEPVFFLAVALFGVATAIFEFLTGGIPFGLVLLLGIVALDGPPDPIMLMRRAWHGSVIFALAILLTFAIKIALVRLFVDANALADFATSLSMRVGSKFVSGLPPGEISWVSAFGIDASSLDRSWASSILYMLARLAYASLVIGYGSPALGMAIVGMAFVTTAVLLIARAQRADEGAMRARLAILVASALAVPVWSLVFLNHTLLHAIWMVRPYGWYVALAGILWFWPVSALEPAAAEAGAPGPKRCSKY